MKKKATTWRQHQKEQKKAVCSEDVVAEEAIDYLEHLRAEHGCEATLTAISAGTQLISAVHTVAHGQEQPPNYTEQKNLTENLLKVAEATSLHPAWQFIALFDAALEFTSKHEAQIRAVVEDKGVPSTEGRRHLIAELNKLHEKDPIGLDERAIAELADLSLQLARHAHDCPLCTTVLDEDNDSVENNCAIRRQIGERVQATATAAKERAVVSKKLDQKVENQQKTVSTDPQLVAAIQEKYPTAEPSRVRMYAQFLTGLRKNKESFNEIEQMVPQSYVKSLGLA